MAKLIALLLAAAVLAGCTVPWQRITDGGPGDRAVDLVSGKEYPKLLVEIDHPPGAGPHPHALEVLKSTLREVTGKTSVEVVLDDSAPAESKKYTYDEIAAIEDEHRDHRTAGDTAVLYVLYVAGGSSRDTDKTVALGAAYRGTSIVMFKGNIRANSGGGPLANRPPEEVVERAVLVHEFGHAAGLVNLGTPMVRPHEDPEHKGHSSNQRSVMYWAVESSAGLALLCNLGIGTECGVPYTFDTDDKADLRALKER